MGGKKLEKIKKKKVNLPMNTVNYLVTKWKKYGTTQMLPRSGCPTKLSNCVNRAIVTEAIRKPAKKTTVAGCVGRNGTDR